MQCRDVIFYESYGKVYDEGHLVVLGWMRRVRPSRVGFWSCHFRENVQNLVNLYASRCVFRAIWLQKGYFYVSLDFSLCLCACLNVNINQFDDVA